MALNCHFCDGDHDFDESGVAACRPKGRFRGAIRAALAVSVQGHPAHCDCDRCAYARVQQLLGRVHFLGEPPDIDFTAALLRRLDAEGYAA